jgi:Dynamin family
MHCACAAHHRCVSDDRVRAILAGMQAAYRGDPTFATRTDVHDRLARIGQRLDEPLRLALAGTLKSGKSTLVNALLGEDIAPTDATESTRIVAWFRHGENPHVAANHLDGRRTNVPISRGRGLTFDLSRIEPSDVVDLDVRWPSEALRTIALADTPGTSSLSRDVSARTLRLLVPSDGVPRVDAVVFLMRHSSAADTALLFQINAIVGGHAGALGVIGVVSRADEIGAGRIDAMFSARKVAARFAAEMEQIGICQAVVPVAGLLALTARTLRQSEFVALQALMRVRPKLLARALLSADQFAREDSPLPLDVATRATLLERFGIFGIRIAVAVLRAGVTDSDDLAQELLERSGLTELRAVIDHRFAQRADLLKTHTALVSMRRFLTIYPIPQSERILCDIDPLLADTHAFEELRLLSQCQSYPTSLSDDEIAAACRLLGAMGTDAASRLALAPEDVDHRGRTAALDEVARWGKRSRHPLNNAFTTRLCRAATRSAEGVLAELGGPRSPRS